MMMGGLRIFGVERKVPREPGRMQRSAAKVFEKYHGLRERFMERMDNPKTKFGMLVNMMLARPPSKAKENAEHIRESLGRLGERIDGREKGERHPVGINQDARGWYNECGRPRYPSISGRGAVMLFDAQNQKQ